MQVPYICTVVPCTKKDCQFAFFLLLFLNSVKKRGMISGQKYFHLFHSYNVTGIHNLLLGCPWGQCPIKKREVTFFLSQIKDKMVGTQNSQKALHASFSIQWYQFYRKGDKSFQLIWQTDLEVNLKHKIIAWSYWPYIYTKWLSKHSIWWFC